MWNGFKYLAFLAIFKFCKVQMNTTLLQFLLPPLVWHPPSSCFLLHYWINYYLPDGTMFFYIQVLWLNFSSNASTPWYTLNNNNNAGVFILRRLHPDDNERVIITLWTEAHYINDDGQSAVGSTRVTSATLHLHVQAATNYTPHHRLGITPNLLPVPIYRPRKDR